MEQGGAGGRCGFWGPDGHRPVARRAYTCAGTCVWCLEAGVRVSRGHECASVCVGGAGVHYRDKWCVRAGYREVGIPLSQRGCVCLEGTGVCRES